MTIDTALLIATMLGLIGFAFQINTRLDQMNARIDDVVHKLSELTERVIRLEERMGQFRA